MNDSIDDPVPDNAKLIKLEAGRSSVQFKPSKRMKKRRQLDALVGNEKKLSRRKSSAHELLRSNDSGSSEVEEFGIIHGHKLEKSWTSSSCCFTCYSLTCALLVTSCLLACATLIWMHLELKRDFNHLRDRLQLVENKNAGTPEEFQALQSRLNLIDKSLSDIRTGKHGLHSLNESIVNMQAQIVSLAAMQQKQQQTIQTSSSSDNSHEDVANTVADLGSGLHSAQNEIKTLKDSQKTFTSQMSQLTAKVTVLENGSGREGGGSQSNTESLQALVTQVNSTLSQSIAKAVADLTVQKTHVEALDQFTQDLQSRVSGVHRLALTLNASQHVMQEALLPQFCISSSPRTCRAECRLTLTLHASQHVMQEALLPQVSSPCVVLVGDSSVSVLHPGPAEQSAGWPLTIHASQHVMQEALLPQNTTATDDLTQLQRKVDELQLTLEQTLLKEHQEFLHFKTEVHHDITILNASVALVNETTDALRKDVREVFGKVNLAEENVSNITTIVEGLVTYIHSHHPSSANRNSPSAPSSGGGADSTTKPGQTTTQSSQPARNSNSERNPRSGMTLGRFPNIGFAV
ncbi:hypothetical protein ACOMHN_012933 [Nucella lapillus]